MLPLTPAQKRCYDAIKALTVGEVGPTYEMIAVGLGLSGRGAAHRLVHELIERGAVTMQPGKYRSIRVVEQIPAHLDPYSAEALARLPRQTLREITWRCSKLIGGVGA